jgi:hypothetical protein
MEVTLMKQKPSDQYNEQETQQRFEKLVDAALRTPPKPLKSMAVGVAAQSKKRRKHKASSR